MALVPLNASILDARTEGSNCAALEGNRPFVRNLEFFGEALLTSNQISPASNGAKSQGTAGRSTGRTSSRNALPRFDGAV